MDDSDRARAEQLKMTAACVPQGGDVTVPADLYRRLLDDYDAHRQKLAEVRAEVERLRRAVNARPEHRR